MGKSNVGYLHLGSSHAGVCEFPPSHWLSAEASTSVIVVELGMKAAVFSLQRQTGNISTKSFRAVQKIRDNAAFLVGICAEHDGVAACH